MKPALLQRSHYQLQSLMAIKSNNLRYLMLFPTGKKCI